MDYLSQPEPNGLWIYFCAWVPDTYPSVEEKEIRHVEVRYIWPVLGYHHPETAGNYNCNYLAFYQHRYVCNLDPRSAGALSIFLLFFLCALRVMHWFAVRVLYLRNKKLLYLLLPLAALHCAPGWLYPELLLYLLPCIMIIEANAHHVPTCHSFHTCWSIFSVLHSRLSISA